jgi:AbiV family abortive infection protein
MYLPAIKAADRADLLACASAAARNVLGLLRDAEMLAGAGSTARAYSLAALAVEECGKAFGLSALAVLPSKLRAQAPAGRMLEWHQLKQVGGLLIAAVPIDTPGMAAKLAAMPTAQATQILTDLASPADEADRLKRRGLYVDMDGTGQIREPSEITEPELASQLARARQSAASADLLLGPDSQARLADPPAEVSELASALVKALIHGGKARTPKAAAHIVQNAVRDLRDTMPMKQAHHRPARATGTAPPETQKWAEQP